MGGFDRGFDRGSESERDRPAEAAAVGDGTAHDGEARVDVETRTRGEAHAGLRQAAGSGWDRYRRFEAPRGELAEMRTFKAELREAILHPDRLPDGELIDNVQPDYRDPEEFLERLAEGYFPQVVLTEGEYEVIHAHGRE